jgi:hypothetical protein
MVGKAMMCGRSAEVCVFIVIKLNEVGNKLARAIAVKKNKMDLESREGDNGGEICAGVPAGVVTGGTTDKDDEGCEDHSRILEMEIESESELEEHDLGMTVAGVQDVKAKYSEERVFSKLVTIKGLSFEEESIGTCVRCLKR